MYIEDVLPTTLQFEFQAVRSRGALKVGVFETISKESVQIPVGCVCIGTANDCREYVAQRRSKQAITAEMRGSNPQVTRW